MSGISELVPGRVLRCSLEALKRAVYLCAVRPPAGCGDPGSVELARDLAAVRVLRDLPRTSSSPYETSATTRWTRETETREGARARVERPPRPGGAATLIVCYKIDRGREGEGVKTATTKLRKGRASLLLVHHGGVGPR